MNLLDHNSIDPQLGELHRKKFETRAATLLSVHAPTIEVENAVADIWEVRVSWGPQSARKDYSGVFSTHKRGMTPDTAMDVGLSQNFEQLQRHYKAWLRQHQEAFDRVA